MVTLNGFHFAQHGSELMEPVLLFKQPALLGSVRVPGLWEAKTERGALL